MVTEPGEVAGPGMQVQLQHGLEQFFMAKQNRLIKFDMAAAMKEAKLDVLFPVELWPASTAVRELATHLKTRKFVFAELAK